MPKSVALFVVNNYTVIQHVKQIYGRFCSFGCFVPKLRRKMCKISSAIFANAFAVLLSTVALPVLNQ